MTIEKQELLLAVLLAGIGFVFSTRQFMVWLNGAPLQISLLAWYIFIFAVTYILLNRIGITVGRTSINGGMKTFGLMLVLFSFFIVTNWGESCWSDIVRKGACDLPGAVKSSEDGVVWNFWETTGKVSNPDTNRILTYVITPFGLALAGAWLVSGKDIASLFNERRRV